MPTETTAAAVVAQYADRLSGQPEDYDALLELIGDARFVLLGEASHGTHEFYAERATITRRLIEEKRFDALAIEGDWPDARCVGRYVRGEGEARTAVEALAEFTRFPTWMWRNRPMADFVQWLRDSNDARAAGEAKTGVYGIDLYSLHASMRSVIRHLQQVDPGAARIARERYACFDHFGEEAQVYGFMTRTGAAESCEREAIAQLLDMQRLAMETVHRDRSTAEEDAFYAEQNARVVAHAERYYRSMFLGNVSTWNLRDEHMVQTIEAIAAFLNRRVGRSRIVVWAHNSHVGDARATEMGRRGELNVGQLLRERHGDDCFSVGFTTHRGTVTAASDWDEPAERKRVRESREDSHERVLHDSGVPRFLLRLRRSAELRETLSSPRLERAIGVVYRPETERQSHYFRARLADQFDALIHLDTTRAVEPLDPAARWSDGERDELPETYPSGM